MKIYKPSRTQVHYSNRPLNKNKHGKAQPRFNRFHFFAGLILIAILAMAWWLTLAPSFSLQEIEASDAKNFSAGDLKTAAWQAAGDQRFLLWPKNLLMLNKKNIAKTLEDKFFIDDLKIKKRLPHKLIISFKEKPYAIAWQEGERLLFINYQGDVIMERAYATSTPGLEQAPVGVTEIFNRSQNLQDGRKININESYLLFADKLNKAFAAKVKGLNDRQIIFNNEANTLNIQISNGPLIKFNTQDDLDRQLNKLEAIRKYRLSDGKLFSSQQYIDLRYGDRVFYQ